MSKDLEIINLDDYSSNENLYKSISKFPQRTPFIVSATINKNTIILNLLLYEQHFTLFNCFYLICFDEVNSTIFHIKIGGAYNDVYHEDMARLISLSYSKYKGKILLAFILLLLKKLNCKTLVLHDRAVKQCYEYRSERIGYNLGTYKLFTIGKMWYESYGFRPSLIGNVRRLKNNSEEETLKEHKENVNSVINYPYPKFKKQILEMRDEIFEICKNYKYSDFEFVNFDSVFNMFSPDKNSLRYRGDSDTKELSKRQILNFMLISLNNATYYMTLIDDSEIRTYGRFLTTLFNKSCSIYSLFIMNWIESNVYNWRTDFECPYFHYYKGEYKEIEICKFILKCANIAEAYQFDF
jgi:hypothetical protein